MVSNREPATGIGPDEISQQDAFREYGGRLHPASVSRRIRNGTWPKPRKVGRENVYSRSEFFELLNGRRDWR